MIEGQNAHFGIFVRNAVPRNFQWIRRHFLGFEIGRGVVLSDCDSPIFYVRK